MKPTRGKDHSISNNFNKISWILLLPFVLGVFLSSCGKDLPSASEKMAMDDLRGTIQGQVIDKATGDPLSDVGITLIYDQNFEEGKEDTIQISATTGSNGEFSIYDVPVNADAKASNLSSEDRKNNPYKLRVDASSLDNYRDSYLMNVDVVFESTGGGDAVATNLVSNVTIPLSERAVELTGKVHTDTDKILSDAKVELYQSFDPVINGDNTDTRTNMLVDTTTTGSDGSFSFSGVEEDATVWLKVKDDSDPTEVVSYESGTHTTPSGDQASPQLDLGKISVTPENQSGAFYLTSVTPEPGSDVTTDTKFIYVFNRPVADNSYTRTDLGFGNGTIKDDIEFDWRGNKKAPGDVEFSVSWGQTRDSLIIDPEESTMQDASEYRLYVNNALQNDKFVDEYENSLTYGASDYNQNNVEFLDFTTNDNNSAPHKPAITATQDADSVDWDNGDLTLKWDVSDSPAEVKEYEIYASKNGGAYQHFMTLNADDEASYGEIEQSIDATSNASEDDFNNDQDWWSVNDLLVVDGSASPVDESNTYKLKVRAISANLVEGDFSDPVTFEDVTKPGVVGTADQGTAGSGNEDHLYINFDEPMDKPAAENASNYTITDDTNGNISISSVTYDLNGVNNPANGLTYDLVIVVDNAGNLTTGDIEISSSVTDLNANGMANDDNTAAY